MQFGQWHVFNAVEEAGRAHPPVSLPFVVNHPLLKETRTLYWATNRASKLPKEVGERGCLRSPAALFPTQDVSLQSQHHFLHGAAWWRSSGKRVRKQDLPCTDTPRCLGSFPGGCDLEIHPAVSLFLAHKYSRSIGKSPQIFLLIQSRKGTASIWYLPEQRGDN